MKTEEDMRKEIFNQVKKEYIWYEYNLPAEMLINLSFKAGKQKAREDILKLIDDYNPYPEDIYPKIELSEFQAQSIDDFLISNLGFPLDRLSAELMRRARENTIEELKQKIKNLEGKNDNTPK